MASSFGLYCFTAFSENLITVSSEAVESLMMLMRMYLSVSVLNIWVPGKLLTFTSSVMDSVGAPVAFTKYDWPIGIYREPPLVPTEPSHTAYALRVGL